MLYYNLERFHNFNKTFFFKGLFPVFKIHQPNALTVSLKKKKDTQLSTT